MIIERDTDTKQVLRVIDQEDDSIIFDREEEQKKIAKKTIKALEQTNGRAETETQTAKDRLEEIW